MLLVVEEAVGVLAARVDDVAADDALLAEVAVALESVQQFHFGSLFAFRQIGQSSRERNCKLPSMGIRGRGFENAA